jgi:hypothetical protein
MSIRLNFWGKNDQPIRFGNFATIEEARQLAEPFKPIFDGDIYIEYKPTISELILTGLPEHTQLIPV